MWKKYSWKIWLPTAAFLIAIALTASKYSTGLGPSAIFAQFRLVRVLVPSLIWWWLIPCGPIFLSIAVLRAVQIRLVFRSVSDVRLHNVFVGKAHADLIGRFLTKYGGYLLLIDFVARREKLPRSALLGPLSVFAPLEAANVLVVTLVASQLVPLSSAMEQRLRLAWLVIAVLALACIVFTVVSQQAIRYVPAWVGRIPVVGGRLEVLTRRWLVSFTGGLRAFGRQAFHHPGQVAAIICLSFVATLLGVLNLFVIGRAAGINLSFVHFLVVAQLATIGSATITTPGPLGVSELVRASLLFGFGVSYWRAISYVIFAEVVWVACLAILNIVLFWSSHVWPWLLRRVAISVGRPAPRLEPAPLPEDPSSLR